MSRQVLAVHLPKDDPGTYRSNESELRYPLHLVADQGMPGEPTAHVQPALVPTVFHEEWWLDAATGGRYSIAEVKAGDKTVGRLPYLVRSRFGKVENATELIGTNSSPSPTPWMTLIVTIVLGDVSRVKPVI